jgi:mannose-6-phosphate isomerase-like protein (cupin superfamily)
MNQSNMINGLDFETKQLPAEYKYLAPDKSEIRKLTQVHRGNMCHCTLPPGCVSLAVKHKSVEELWYFIQGIGKMWRKQDEHEEVIDVMPGLSLSIPTGTHFQFRNNGGEPLCFVIVSMPPWQDDVEEAVRVKDYWSVEEY